VGGSAIGVGTHIYEGLYTTKDVALTEVVGAEEKGFLQWASHLFCQYRPIIKMVYMHTAAD